MARLVFSRTVASIEKRHRPIFLPSTSSPDGGNFASLAERVSTAAADDDDDDDDDILASTHSTSALASPPSLCERRSLSGTTRVCGCTRTSSAPCIACVSRP
ncbi:hypothetical protein LY76DRAFT_595411 [Colletotrichum caudatum]|nr:hypothetical protein LY76DRAFT_595411 [Colletotrichum caudatum]